MMQKITAEENRVLGELRAAVEAALQARGLLRAAEPFFVKTILARFNEWIKTDPEAKLVLELHNKLRAAVAEGARAQASIAELNEDEEGHDE